MFHGTTIEELMQIVKRAEDHAQEIEVRNSMSKSLEFLPGFFYEASRAKQNWIEVA